MFNFGFGGSGLIRFLFRWFRWFRWFRSGGSGGSGGFVPVVPVVSFRLFRVLVHAMKFDYSITMAGFCTFLKKSCTLGKGQLAFLTKAKICHFLLGVLSALMNDSRKFKQCEKRLFKVVTVNLPLYKQLEY